MALFTCLECMEKFYLPVQGSYQFIERMEMRYIVHYVSVFSIVKLSLMNVASSANQASVSLKPPPRGRPVALAISFIFMVQMYEKSSNRQNK